MRCSAAPRVSFEEPVTLIWADRSSCQATALNLCRSGMFVCAEAGDEPIPPQLRVRFELPDGASVDVPARVVRMSGPEQAPGPSGPSERESHEPPGVALRFESMSEDCAERLDSFIARCLESTAGERVHLASGSLHDEEHDPVLTQAFAEHVGSHEQRRLGAADAAAKY